jgi:hypothetical protein
MASVVPDPDFTDTRAVQVYLNTVRRTLHRAAMELHVAASELEAALSTIPAVDAGAMMARSVQRRRARRVARHLRHSAECLVAGSAASVRTWGAYRATYLGGTTTVRGPRPVHRVVKP